MGFLRDVRHSIRSLARRPLLTAAAVASLALGIGVNSAIFSVFDRLVLSKLPVPAPDEIVILSSPGRKPGSTTAGDSGTSDQVFSYPLFRDLERLSTTRLSRIVAHRAKHLPSQLSGGQQQRVAVARAVAGEPLILLADEPTGNLDSKNGEAVMDLLKELHQSGATICMVTHDARYASHAARTIHLFDGRVVEESVAVV